MKTYLMNYVSMQTRDGVRLDADVYLPTLIAPGQTFPVLLMRQPYGRSIASTVVYAHPSWYAAQGYIVVIQDLRGRGTSEGVFSLFESEIEDGYDAVMWAANLPHSNGLVGMYGFSYQGMTQLYAAAQRPEPLRTICPAMLAYDLREDWAYEHDVFCLQSNLGWAIQLAAETARLVGNNQYFQLLKTSANNLPLNGEIPAYPEILKSLAPDSFYHDWISRSENDPYWKKLSPRYFIDAISDLPMLHIGGWFDPYLRGTLRLYDAMCKTAAPQHLIIGPWAHLPWGRQAGIVDFGAVAVSDCDRAQVRWFDYWLKGEGLLENGAIWFEMGTNCWVKADQWKEGVDHQMWQLKTTELTSMRGGDLVLVDGIDIDRISNSSSNSSSNSIADAIVHDPWRPVPSFGGHAGSPAGPMDRRAIDDRTDVLCYTSPVLIRPLLIQGTPTIEVEFFSDAKSIDLHVVLSQVNAMGRVLTIAQGVYTVCPQNETTATISMQTTSTVIPIDSALRLSISLSCFPAFPVNSGTGILAADAKLIDAQVVTLFLQGGVLKLPIGLTESI
jgi:putative CocE/NonD family hydrolase